MDKMKGWKTVAGAVVIGIGAGLTSIGMAEVGKAVEGLGIALMGIGVAGKFKKLGDG